MKRRYPAQVIAPWKLQDGNAKMEGDSAAQRFGGGSGRLCVCRESGWTADKVECRVTHRISSDPDAVPSAAA